MNRGILCAACNKGFSDLDAKLARDLAALSARIGVVSRHKRRCVEVPVYDPVTGEQYILRGGSEIRHAHVKKRSEEVVDGQRATHYVCSDEVQLQELRRKLAASGAHVEITVTRDDPMYFPAPLRLDVGFGGDESFRAVGRVALNFLAHRFPDVARQEGTRNFKEYVLGRAPNQHVFFDYDERYDAGPARAPLTHRVVVGVNRERSTAFAHVSLLGLVELTVLFGTVSGQPTRAIAFDIDPAVVHKMEARKHREHSPAGVAATPVPITDTNAYAEPDGDALKTAFSERLGRVLAQVREVEWEYTSKRLLPSILASSAREALEQLAEIGKLLRPQQQRMLNLGKAAVRTVEAAELRDGDGGLAARLKRLIEADPTSRTGVTPEAENFLEQALQVAAIAVQHQMKTNLLTDAFLRDLLEGRLGVRLVGELMLRLVAAEPVDGVAPPSKEKE